MFQNQELIYIDGYSVSLEWSGSSYFYYSFSLNNNLATFVSSSSYFDGYTAEQTYAFKNNLTSTYSTIVPWKNPNS